MKRRSLIFFIIFLFASGKVFAAKYKGEVFLLFSDAKSLSMGEVGVSYPLGLNSPYWNPALLYSIASGISFSHSEYYEGLVRVEQFILTRRKGFMNLPLGISVNYVHTKPVEITSLIDEELGVAEGNIEVTGSGKYTFTSVYLSTSKVFKKGITAGINLKFFHENLYATTETGIGLDLGIAGRTKSFSYGFNVRDIIFSPFKKPDGYESVYPSFLIGAGKEGKKSVFCIELEIHTDGRYEGSLLAYRFLSADLHVGGEYQLSETVSLRAGFSRGRFTAGAGIKFKKLNIDYALYPHTDLGLNHKLTLTLWY